MTTDHNEAMRPADALAQPGVRYATETEAQAKLRRIKNQAEAAALIRKQAERIAELEAERDATSAKLEDLQSTFDYVKERRAQISHRLWVWAHEELSEPLKTRYFNIVANGTADVMEQPTYAQQYNYQKYRADKAEAERDTLRAEVERLRVDAERMDWLEMHATDAHAIHDKDGHVQSFQFDCDEDDSLRAAIDTARKATP